MFHSPQALRNGIRMLGSARGLAIVAVLSLGIAVNVAVFSVVHAVLVRPLPHPDPGRLVAIASRDLTDGREHQMAPLDFFDFERQSSSFDRIAAYYPPGFTITGNSAAERVAGARATSGIFTVFGVRPILGRSFRPDEDKPGAARVVVMSHGLWTRRFNSDPAIVSQSIVMSGNVYAVVGVLPEGFATPAMWPRMPDVWVPLGLDPNVASREARMLRVLGRLRGGVTIEQARADLDRVAAVLARTHPDTNRATGVVVAPLLEQLTRDARPSLLILVAGVAALLLVAIGNAAGLILVGTLQRRSELTTRLALGATRGQLVRQIVAEHVILGAIAGVCGFALAYLAADVLVDIAAAAGVPRAPEILVGGLSLAIGFALSIACTIVCSLIAGISTVTRAAKSGLVRDTRALTRSHRRTQATLLAVEAAFSLALLAAGTLLIRSFYELQTLDPGFDASRTFTLRLSPPAARYPAGPVLTGFYDRVLERVKTVPGIGSAAVVDWVPATGAGSMIGFTTNDTGDRNRHLAELRIVSQDYFRTLAIPVVAGRGFDARDRDSTPHVAIVNESFARAHFGRVDVVGRSITFDRGQPTSAEIVGVTRDVREVSRRVAPSPGVYVPKTQRPWLTAETRELIVRATGDGPPSAATLQAIVRELEPDVPLGPLQPLAEVTSQPVLRAELYASAVTAFAAIAMLLAAFGVYGAVASIVTQRARQIGICMALGATSTRVVRETARHGLAPTVVGLVIGAPLALGAGYVVRQQLFEVQPNDPITLGAVAVLMLAVTAAASFVPAMRAAKIDPAVTLRHESSG
jgi:putative ABC transport system permease protein